MNLSRIEGVTFDLEGTIVNLEPYHWAAHVATAESLGIAIDLDDPRTFTELQHFIGGPNEKIMEEILDLAEIRSLWEPGKEPKEIKLASMKAKDRTTYRDLRDSLDKMPPREGFLDFLDQLRSQNIPVAIGSLT